MDLKGYLASNETLPYREGMEVRFTPEQEAQLAQLSSKAGTNAEHLVKEAALRLLDARKFEVGFPEYSVASRVEGWLSVELSWEELKPYLTNGFNPALLPQPVGLSPR